MNLNLRRVMSQHWATAPRAIRCSPYCFLLPVSVRVSDVHAAGKVIEGK